MDEQQIVQTEENRQPAKDQNELHPPTSAMDLHAVHLDQLTRALPQQGREVHRLRTPAVAKADTVATPSWEARLEIRELAEPRGGYRRAFYAGRASR